MLAERLEVVVLLLPDEVEVELVVAELEVLLEPLDVLRRLVAHEDRAAHLLGGDVLADGVEPGDGVDVPRDRRADDVGAPLVVGDRQGLLLGGCPGQVDLEAGRSAASGVAVGGEDFAEPLDGLVDGDEAGRPVGVPGRPSPG